MKLVTPIYQNVYRMPDGKLIIYMSAYDSPEEAKEAAIRQVKADTYIGTVKYECWNLLEYEKK